MKKTSEIYTHKNKSSSSGYSHDGSYKIVDHIRSKDRVTGEWYDSILYQDIKSGDMYSREKKDFMDKFKKSEL